MLRQAAVEPLLVKGWAAATLYPDLGLRPFGDLDLLIRPREFETARAALKVEAARDCLVDLHLRFPELKGRSIDDLFARSRLVALERGHVRVLAAEDHLALQAIHLLKHGAWRPLWLCDVAAAIESLPDGFNWKVCLGSDQLRRSWIQATLGLAKQLLGADCAKLPFNTIRVPRWMEKSVLKQWGSLWPANHLPIQPPPLMAATLNGRSGLLKATLQRWPDPITATFKLNGAFTTFPRLPYQLGEFTSRAGRFLLRRPKTVPSSN